MLNTYSIIGKPYLEIIASYRAKLGKSHCFIQKLNLPNKKMNRQHLPCSRNVTMKIKNHRSAMLYDCCVFDVRE